MGQFEKNSQGSSIGTAGFSERGKSSKDISSPSECSRRPATVAAVTLPSRCKKRLVAGGVRRPQMRGA